MRGMFAPPRLGAVAGRWVSASHWIWLAFAILASTAALSGCAAVSAEKSSSDPAAAKISVVPSVIDFKSVVVGQKNSQTVTITNGGADSIRLDSLLVSGAGLTASPPKTPVALAPGQNFRVSVVFAPSSASAMSGSLVIASSDLELPLRVPISGSGEKNAPEIQVSPPSLSFGSRAVNSSAFQTVTLANTGNVSLKISSVALSNPAFSLTGLSAGVSLSPDQKLQFQVWFHPKAAGKSSASITVNSTSLSLPVTLAITGSAADSSSGTPPAATPSHSVALDWEPSASTVAGYHVYRGGSSSGPYSRISSSLINSLTYKDTSVESGDHYYYVVTAVEADGTESAYSNEVAVDIPTN